MAQNPIVTFEMEDGGKMVAELYPEVAPNTVNNFISLVKSGFYNGLIFHRVRAPVPAAPATALRASFPPTAYRTT